MASSSINALSKKHKFDLRKYDSPNMYVNEIITMSTEIIRNGKESLENLKNENAGHFNRQMQQVYQILIENIELRGLLNESNKKLLLKAG